MKIFIVIVLFLLSGLSLSQAAHTITTADESQMFTSLANTTPALLERVSKALVFDSKTFTSTTDGKKYWAIRYLSDGVRYCLIFDETKPIIKPATHFGYWNFVTYQTNAYYADEAMVTWCIG